MEYIFTGMLLGSLVTSIHPNKEACEGRKVTMAENKVVGGSCHQINTHIGHGTSYCTSLGCSIQGSTK